MSRKESTDRIPPHSIEAEQGVIGCCLIDPNASIAQCVCDLKGTFVLYEQRHQTIYAELVTMFDAKLPIDIITLQERLKADGRLDAVGGVAYISSLVDVVPSAANLPSYVEIVKDRYLARQLIRECGELAVEAHNCPSSEELLESAGKRMVAVITEHSVNAGYAPVEKLAQDAMEFFEQCYNNKGKMLGLSTGYPDLDKITGGLKNSDMVVVAGRPSTGKSSLAGNIAEHIAVSQGMPVGIFSLEMSKEQLVRRMMCSQSHLNERLLTSGDIAEADFPKLGGAYTKIAKAPIHIDDTSGLSILQLRAASRRMVQQFGLKLIIIDYLQLLKSTKRNAHNREEEIADISFGVKGLAKELNIPIVALSQLNRDIEHEQNRKPRLSDLRGSGSIEQDADVVGLLYATTKADEAPAKIVPTNLIIAKQRNGPTGEVKFMFNRECTRFEPVTPVPVIDESDKPQF